MAAAQVEVVGEAQQEEETQQETGQKEAAKVQNEQDATSGNIQKKMGETSEDNTKPTVAGKGKRYDRFIHKNILNHVLYG